MQNRKKSGSLILVVLTMFLMMSCEDGGMNDGVCDFTTYNGSGNCGAGYAPVDATGCCPDGFPYYCQGSGSCYASCEGAKEDGCSNTIIKANLYGTNNTGNNNTGNNNTGNNNTGNSGSCTWNSAPSCLSVSTAWNTRCTTDDSYEVTVVNNCSYPIKVYCCIKKTNGEWDSSADGIFNSGIQPGDKMRFYTCSGTGDYKLYTMSAADFKEGNCKYPDCQ